MAGGSAIVAGGRVVSHAASRAMCAERDTANTAALRRLPKPQTPV
jgi:hypothetical protein